MLNNNNFLIISFFFIEIIPFNLNIIINKILIIIKIANFFNINIITIIPYFFIIF